MILRACCDLTRRLKLLSPSFDELRDKTEEELMWENESQSLFELLDALVAAKDLLLSVNDGSKVYQASPNNKLIAYAEDTKGDDIYTVYVIDAEKAKSNFSDDLSVATALLDPYAKCGSLDSSRRIFKGMTEKNLLSWNAMIGALGMNGCAREALAAFEEMTQQNVKPNDVRMLSVLSACSHGGLIQEGLLFFQRMSEDLYNL